MKGTDKALWICFAVVLAQIAIIGFLFSGCKASVNKYDFDQNGSNAYESVSENAYIECVFSDRLIMDHFIRAAEPYKDVSDTDAVIVPHYGNALYMLCNLFSGIDRNVDLVVLAGPNHSGNGEAIQISGSNWFWDTGGISGDAANARLLAQNTGAIMSDDVISQDWSVQTIIPYISYYFPDAELITMLFTRAADEDAIVSLSNSILSLREKCDILLVGSVDFSHYLAPQSAWQNDEYVIPLIENGDTAGLSVLDNGYLDSPQTASLVMNYAKSNENALVRCDSLFECFYENGQEKAGSYHTFASQ